MKKYYNLTIVRNVTAYFFIVVLEKMHLLSKKIVESMQIPDEDKELYEYGVIVFLKKILFYVIIFACMVIFKQEMEGLFFLVAFSYLRRNAGGFHCKSFISCFLLSVSSIVVSLLLIRYEVFGILYYRSAFLISQAVLIMMRPVDCENKRVDKEEKDYFYKQEKIVLGIIDIVILALMFFGLIPIEKSVESAVILVGITSIIAFFSQKMAGLTNQISHLRNPVFQEYPKWKERRQTMLLYVCDDNEIHQKKICIILKEYCLDKKIPLEIKCFSDGQALLFGMQEEGKPIDAFFMDIEIQKENGIEIAKEIKKTYKESNIVYISSHEKYVFQSFETEPMDYLLKPLKKEHVFKVMNRICDRVGRNKTISFVVSRKEIELDVDSILYMESSKRILNIYTDHEIYRTYIKMDEMMEKLNEVSTSFVRIHRSVLINYDHVKRIKGDEIVLDNDAYLTISRNYKIPFKQFSMQYIECKVNLM